MPNVLSCTPDWLSRPSPGFDLLSASTVGKASDTTIAAPNRRLAHRGSEVFFATGTELRWGDLTLIETAFSQDSFADSGKGWRNLKVPVVHPIQQISISPDTSLLAVVTRHTCHICVLPAPSHLRSGEESTLRLRSYQLGPAAHVLEQAAIVSCLWHPLSIPGLQSLVTLTEDACVRLWELDLDNRYSFDQPGVAVDLKKLANATTTASDFSASKFGANRGFSPDDVEMVVAAACFGGQGLDNEHGWSSMTLWIAMEEGDIYALCPLLPTRFRLSSSTLPTLSTEIVAEAQVHAADSQISEAERRRSASQTAWLTEIDNQEPVLLAGHNEFDLVETYSRPERPAAIAKLQGPFQLSSATMSSPITDIFAIAPVVDVAELYEDESDDEYTDNGLSMAVLCLATASGHVHICLDRAGVQAQWLPHKRSRAITLDDEDDDDMDASDLLLFQTAKLPAAAESTALPVFTQSSLDRYELLATTSKGVFNIDLKPWVAALEAELAGESASGIDFRLKMLVESASTIISPVISASSSDAFENANAAIAMVDTNLGYFVLTTTTAGPHAATLDVPYETAHPYEPEILALPAPAPRDTYQPSAAFYAPSELSKTMDVKRANPVIKSQLAQPIRTGLEALQLLTESHRVLSHETHRLGLAAADLFRRCERMCAEMSNQVSKVEEISQQVLCVTVSESTDNELGDEDPSKDAHIDQRIIKIQSEASNMSDRLEQLRRKMLRLGGEELSNKERAFTNEIWQLQDMTKDDSVLSAPVDSMSILKLPDHEGEASSLSEQDSKGTLVLRLQHATEVSDGLISQADEYAGQQQDGDLDSTRGNGTSNEYKRQKLDRVMQLLERESALMEAVSERLGRLGGLS